MLFKNATIVRIAGEIPCDPAVIAEALADKKFVPAQPMESERLGWISPTGREDDELVRSQGAICLICMQIESKILPPSVIKEELKERLAARGAGGRKVRAKERQQLMEEIRFDLLPKAFSKYNRVMGYIDFQRQEIIVGTASPGQVDDFLAFLRVSLGSLPVKLLESEVSPQMRMTDWAKSRQAPDRVKFGQQITLIDPSEGGKGSFSKQDLTSDEILQCIESGKRVQRLALAWNDYLSFTIDDQLVLRKIAPLDMFDEEYEGDDDENSRLDADLFLTSSALRRLLPELYRWFEVAALEHGADLYQPASNEEELDNGFDVDEVASHPDDLDEPPFEYDDQASEIKEQDVETESDLAETALA